MILSPKTPVWARILIWVVIVVLIFSVIRGCVNEKKANVNASSLLAENKRLQDLHIEDSINGVKSKEAYNDTIDVINGQLSLKENQVLSSQSDLRVAGKRIDDLLARYVAIPPDTDTSVTLVPNEYIENCAECFGELKSGKDLVKSTMAKMDNLDQEYRSKINVQNNRINGLEAEKGRLNKSYNTLKTKNDSLSKSIQPHGKLYLSWGVLWRPWPVGAGGGFMYQNKRNLIWGAKVYYGVGGTTVETTINFPLSLKFK